MRKSLLRAFSALLAVVLIAPGPARAAQPDRSIVVASTTSTQDSGLFDYLLPIVKERTGITVKVVAQGTGQALDTGRRGDADVVFVHAKSAELKFLAEGESPKRYPVMYNDFILVGPAEDPAHVAGQRNVLQALQSIKDREAPFISRGDQSGIDSAELLQLLAGQRHRYRARKRQLVQVHRTRHGGGAQHRERQRCHHPERSGRPGYILKTRVTLRSWWRAISTSSINMA